MGPFYLDLLPRVDGAGASFDSPAAFWVVRLTRLCTHCEDVDRQNGKKLARKTQDEKLLLHPINARHLSHKAARGVLGKIDWSY